MNTDVETARILAGMPADERKVLLDFAASKNALTGMRSRLTQLKKELDDLERRITEEEKVFEGHRKTLLESVGGTSEQG